MLFLEQKVVDRELDWGIQANVRIKTRDSTEKESCSSMKASIQNLIQKFTTVVFEKDETEFQDMSELESLLPLLASQDHNSDVEIKIWNGQLASGIKQSRLTTWWIKMKKVELKK